MKRSVPQTWWTVVACAAMVAGGHYLATVNGADDAVPQEHSPVALIDITKIFKQHKQFGKQLDNMKLAVAEAELALQDEQGKLRELAKEMEAFADHVRDTFNTKHINLLFNNAGIAGGGSFLKETREQWEKTFSVCWGGVYNGARAFMPLLVASEQGHIINTSSINGLWASAGPQAAHTAYGAAKFAVRGFTEALITDLRLNAPHVQASVVMPGHIGTSILLNSTITGMNSNDGGRTLLRMMGTDVETMSDAEVEDAVRSAGESFRDKAPTTAAEAATIILDGVKGDRWRILIGADAHSLDELVRAAPEEAYEPSFVARWAAAREQ